MRDLEDLFGVCACIVLIDLRTFYFIIALPWALYIHKLNLFPRPALPYGIDNSLNRVSRLFEDRVSISLPPLSYHAIRILATLL